MARRRLGCDYVNKIICGDACQIMKNIPDCYVDLTLTSPPYDNLRSYKGYTFDFKTMARELYRLTKEGGVLVWVVGDETKDGNETGTSFRQALYFKEIGFKLHDTMIYAKSAIHTSNVRYRQDFEYMFILCKGKLKTFNPLYIKNKNNTGRARSLCNRQRNGTLKRSIKKPLDSKLISNIWHINTGYSLSTKDKIAFKHPAIFPEKLVKGHITSWSNFGDIVLDPMCGSGTTLKMAKLLGRKYIGIDLSEEYCEISRERVSYVK